MVKEVIKGNDCWDLPGGKIEFKETPIDALNREVKEEVGLNISVVKLAGVYWFYKYRGGGQVICITYLCKPDHTTIDLSKNPSEREKIFAYRWVSKEEFLKAKYPVNKSLIKHISDLQIN